MQILLYVYSHIHLRLTSTSIILQREELFAALDEVTENHMTLKENLEQARALNHEKMLEREEAEAECKEVSVKRYTYVYSTFIERIKLTAKQ